MIYVFVAFAYVLFLLLLMRFFGAVHSWDEKIRSMHVSSIRRFSKLSGQKAT